MSNTDLMQTIHSRVYKNKINQKIKFEYRMSRDIIKDKKGVCLEILSKIERGQVV